MIGELTFYSAPVDMRIFLLSKKIEEWKNTVSDATLDAQVALVCNDTRLLQAAEKRLKNAIMAIEYLEAELDALTIPQDGDGGEIDEPTEEPEL